MKCVNALLLGLSVLALAGCAGKNDQASDACLAAVAEKFGAEQYAVDTTALVASAKEQPDNVVLLQSDITFKPGLPGEYKQKVECKVRFDATPTVISLVFYY